ncbi:C40 family peptidase [Ornithinimicrobium sp. LYQ121]|uniref:C40 family peptidase n=1 Tax=Ornithinimicrobium sp. LYQ121 TaxID=3378801 RepID=UPI0038519DD9
MHPTTTVQAPAARSAGSLLDVAAAYVGYPYVLYGTPPQSFDCSAYTWYVFQQAGIDIPRAVAGQKGAVTPVSDPQPGDLVFYNDWYHVGIYAGGGMTYEALNPSTDVRYGPLLSSNVWYGRIN